MSPHGLAAMLAGREYGDEVTSAEAEAAKVARLVIAFGASDDLLEFRGAINDEVGAYEGTTVRVDREGLRPAWPEDLVSEEWARAFFAREGKPSAEVRAIWSDTDAPCWTIQTDVPHATFVIMEDDEPYCTGIVFALADIPQAAP